MALSNHIGNIFGKPLKPRGAIFSNETNMESDFGVVFEEADIVYQLEHSSEIVLDDKGNMHGRLYLAIDEGAFNPMTADPFDSAQGMGVTVQASPILMAILLKRYDLVKGLIEQGFPAAAENTKWSTFELIGCCKIGDFEHLFTLGQFIMGDPDMPDELRLFLWQHSAEDMKKKSKQAKRPRGKVIDFSWFDFDMGFAFGFFNKLGKAENIFFKTFMHSLKLFAKKRPHYLKNIIDESWRRIMCFTCFRYFEQIMEILLRHVPLSEKMKCRLVKGDFSAYVPTRHVGSAELARVAELLSKLKPYYQSDRLKRALLEFGTKIYLYYKTGNGFFREESKRQKDEEKYVRLLRGFKAREMSLSSCLLLFQSTNITNSDWFSKVLQAYKTVTGRKVVFDESIEVRDVEPVVYFKQPYIKQQNDKIIVNIHEQTDWVEYVDSYAYSNMNELSSVQKIILKRCGEDMLLFAIRRKLLHGKQLDLAIAYCLEQENLRARIPCLLAIA